MNVQASNACPGLSISLKMELSIRDNSNKKEKLGEGFRDGFSGNESWQTLGDRGVSVRKS